MSETKLLPCPFCGQTDQLQLDTLGDPDDWFVECDRCRLGTHAVFVGKERAIAAWNTRTPDPRIDAAQGVVDALTVLRDQLGFRAVGSDATRKRENAIQAGWEAANAALEAWEKLQ